MILLVDINDNAPVFQPSIYSVAEDVYAGYILENATYATEILFVQATDEDSGSLGKVTYSFIAPSSKFISNDMYALCSRVLAIYAHPVKVVQEICTTFQIFCIFRYVLHTIKTFAKCI